ncbi:MAG: MBL fold metallo-hydrolase [Planctomycetota bacterium]
MRLTQIRNATILIEIGEHRILVDPMLSNVGALPGFRFFRGERRKNPLTELPTDCRPLMETATEVLITHEHPDHLDPPALDWMKSHDLKVWCSRQDVANLKKKGLRAAAITEDSGDLHVEVIPATHGHGLMGWLMGPVAGYYLSHPNEPTIYLTSDTVLTDTVKRAIVRLQPQVIVAPAGTANFGVGRDVIFSEHELIDFVNLAQGKVVFNHLESIDHCLMTRSRLRQLIEQSGHTHRVLIPDDGQTIEFPIDRQAAHVEPSESNEREPGFQKWLTAKFSGT